MRTRWINAHRTDRHPNQRRAHNDGMNGGIGKAEALVRWRMRRRRVRREGTVKSEPRLFSPRPRRALRGQPSPSCAWLFFLLTAVSQSPLCNAVPPFAPPSSSTPSRLRPPTAIVYPNPTFDTPRLEQSRRSPLAIAVHVFSLQALSIPSLHLASFVTFRPAP